MIRRSPEIESIVRRWTTSVRTHKVDDLPHYLSHSDALLYIGTADGESWRGQMVRDGIAAHMAELPDFTEADVEIDAWEHGETGWANYKSHFEFADTRYTGVHRITFVFVLERGGWKMVQHHVSQADNNMEKMGIEHGAFAALVAAAQREDAHDFGTEGQASIMFTDIAGSTALAQAVGDRVWMQSVSAHMKIVAACIAAHGGTLVKSLGDGSMSAFTSARDALNAARQIQARVAAARSDPVIEVRIGVHTGPVIQAQDDFFGTVVNKAARIADTALAGEIRISDATRDMAGDAHGFSAALAIDLKGISGTQSVFVLRDN